MTSRPRRGLLVLICVLAACASREPQRTETTDGGSVVTASDSVALRATLDQWYAAMQAVDSAAIVAPLTAQFLLLEDTLPLQAPQLVARLKRGAGSGTWTAAFSDMQTRRVGDVAWTTLRNHETSRDGSGKRCDADFLETVVFVRQQQRWLIDRYHAALWHPWRCDS